VRADLLSAWLKRAALSAACAIAVVIAACQPLPHPFADQGVPPGLLPVPDSVDITVGSVEGEPRAAAAKLPAAMAKELLKHSIPASDETTSRASYRLDGRIEERRGQAGMSLLTVFWRLRDAQGNIVNERSDRLAASTGDWTNGNDERIAQLAAAGANGFATLLADKTPKEQPGGGRTRVAVRKIAGAPGDGNDSLASSLSELLKHQDIELVDPAQGRPDLDVDAEVKVDPAKDNKQHVKITWRVARAGGNEVGQVAQENDVPRGRLDGPWGDVAYSVAMAAEGGILQLLDHGSARKSVPEATAAIEPSSLSAAAGAPSLPVGSASPPAGPPVAGNIDSPEVNLPPVSVTPDTLPKRPAADAPVVVPYRGVPIPH
jgi:hypothetical protein